ncbi:hypothetical protein [Streptomyces thermolilacinus]|uniref:hypothetical protein n=1 Tax=Streptomyces thermolilacinus TaxID=285540 RepID=UPI0033C95C20
MRSRQAAAGIAAALEAACLLQSPETAAELTRLRARVAELETRPSPAETLHEAATVAGECAEELRASGGEMAIDREYGAAYVCDTLLRLAASEQPAPLSQTAAEVLAERSTPWVGDREDRYVPPLHTTYATPHDLPEPGVTA